MARVFKPKKTSGAVKTAGFVAAVVAIVILIYVGLGNISASQDEKQLDIARDAIIKAAVQCYALESQYPSSLKYLADNYGLALDETKYVYHYRAIGSNMAPEIQVFPQTDAGGRG